MSAAAVPAVSVVVPAYCSGATSAAFLAALAAQTFSDFETIIVDSGPEDELVHLVAARFRAVRLERAPARLLPHEARNRGAELARAPLLVFTDPDTVPEPGWLAALVAAHRACGAVVAGAVALVGSGWMATAAHLAKYDLFLPSGTLRPHGLGATAALLCPRALFEQLGGFRGTYFCADTLLCWELERRGTPVWIAPAAVTRHDHRTTAGQLLAERFARGRDFGLARSECAGWGRPRLVAMLAVSVLGPRLLRLVARVAGNARRAGLAGGFARTAPLVAAAEAAWLAGEAAAFSGRFFGRRGGR
jgi:GT2 family glycosyltransferase